MQIFPSFRQPPFQAYHCTMAFSLQPARLPHCRVSRQPGTMQHFPDAAFRVELPSGRTRFSNVMQSVRPFLSSFYHFSACSVLMLRAAPFSLLLPFRKPPPRFVAFCACRSLHFSRDLCFLFSSRDVTSPGCLNARFTRPQTPFSSILMQ